MSVPNLRLPAEKGELARVEKRREVLEKHFVKGTTVADFPELFSMNFPAELAGQKNCENLIGSVGISVGVAGPVRIISKVLNEEVMVPMATTEGALVASYNRGCKVITQSGGAAVFVRKIGITRAPVFSCKDGVSAREFEKWLYKNKSKVAKITESTSRHLRLLDFKVWIRGKYVYVRFVFDADQAMGMNMASIALQHLWDTHLSKLTALKKWGVQLVSLSSNVCADKKDSAMNQLLGRGYEVQAEVVIPRKKLKELLHVEPEAFFHTHVVKNLHGSNLAGSMSQNMHFANGLMALFLATGQDPAHVVEASQGSTIVEVTKEGLYVAAVLPALNLGTVGGGTWLPAQSQARKLIRLGKNVSSEQLAAVMGAAVLAGEISGLAALTDHTLAPAHKRLARTRK
jgi:hydroxymethylglutaryl-CoA reductase (NADPH)